MPDQTDSSPVPKPLRRFALLIAVVVAAIPIGGWYLYDRSVVAKGSGSYLLRINVVSARPIREVRCYPAFRREDAAVVGDNPDREWDFITRSGRFAPFTGAPLEMRIDTWCDTTRSGREIKSGHETWLAVIAEFDEGIRVGKVVEIPDMKVGREVRVEFP